MPNERQPPRSSMSGTTPGREMPDENTVPAPLQMPLPKPVSVSLPMPPSVPVPSQANGYAPTARSSVSKSNVFNVPRPGQARPEFHKPEQSRSSASYGVGVPLQTATKGLWTPVPSGATTHEQPALGSSQGFKSVNSAVAPSSSSFNSINVPTQAHHPDDVHFDANKALNERQFGAPDANAYVSSEQATNDMKALLEGGFGDDEEGGLKLRIRRRNPRRKAAEKARLDSKSVEAEKKPSGVESDHDDDDEEVVEDGSVDGLAVKLLPHQVEGVAWMLDRENGKRKRNGVLPKGGILADDMGLGKTVQTIALLLTNPRPDPAELARSRDRSSSRPTFPEHVSSSTLIVAPLALIRQWEAELKDKVLPDSQMSVVVHHGSSRTKKASALVKSDIVITTYQILASELAVYEDALESEKAESDGAKEVDGAALFGVQWYRVVLDEAHSIKNRSAKCTKGAYRLHSHYRWCLTGTPMQNSLDELQSLIKFLQIRPYCERAHWTEQILAPMKNNKAGLAIRRLQYFLKAIMKRRTKDVLRQEGALTFGGAKAAAKGGSESSDTEEAPAFKIQPRTVELVKAEFDERERTLYDKILTRAQSRLEDIISSSKQDYIGALVMLMRLRQSCNHPQLVAASVAKDHDAVFGNGESKKSKEKGDVDEIAGLLGGLSVAKHRCEICTVEIPAERTAEGHAHCSDCAADVADATKSKSKSKSKAKREGRSRADRGSSRFVFADDGDAAGNTSWVPAGSSDEDEEDDKEDDSDNDDLPFTSTKIRHLLDILAKETPEHKTIVFSEFTSMLDLVEPFLRHAGYGFARYDGSMRNDHREASLARLRNDDDTRILLCSLKCGGLGLNLTAASRVVLLEPFWNPFAESQAIDRVHRLNQTKPVHVYRLTIANSVEEQILALQEAKQTLANAALESGMGRRKKGAPGPSAQKLSFDDILRLFGRGAEQDPDEHHGASVGVDGPAPKFSGYFSAGRNAGPVPAVAVDGSTVSGGVYPRAS